MSSPYLPHPSPNPSQLMVALELEVAALVVALLEVIWAARVVHLEAVLTVPLEAVQAVLSGVAGQLTLAVHSEAVPVARTVEVVLTGQEVWVVALEQVVRVVALEQVVRMAPEVVTSQVAVNTATAANMQVALTPQEMPMPAAAPAKMPMPVAAKAELWYDLAAHLSNAAPLSARISTGMA